MRKIGAILALTAAVACVAVLGLKFMGGSSSSLGGIAVVDLDKVAQETGKSVEMRDALKLQENSYNQRLTGFRNAAINQLQAEAKEIKEQEDKGDKPVEGAKRDLAVKLQKANTILVQAQNEAGSALNQMLQVQIAKFRAELKPLVQEAAAKRGLSVVIPKNDGLLLSVEPGVDITDDVIKAYKTKRPAPTAAAPAPTAPTPTASAPTAAAPKATPAAQDDDVPAPAAAQSAAAPSRTERSTKSERTRVERTAAAEEQTIPAETSTATEEEAPARSKLTRRPNPRKQVDSDLK